jgi:hypothetical protein
MCPTVFIFFIPEEISDFLIQGCPSLCQSFIYVKSTDDQEQYSRRTNLKISGIEEQGREENTDDLVLDVINNLILKHQGVSLNYSHIGRTHRVGPPPTTSTKNRPRHIIIRFISYRDRDLVFRNKKNLSYLDGLFS